MNNFPIEELEAAAKRFNAGWEEGDAPIEYWKPYLVMMYVEGARHIYSLAKAGLLTDSPTPKKRAKKKAATKRRKK